MLSIFANRAAIFAFFSNFRRYFKDFINNRGKNIDFYTPVLSTTPWNSKKMFILCVHRLVFYILSTVLPYLWFTLYFHHDFYVCTGKMLIFAYTWIKFHRVPEVLALDLMDTENYLFKSVDLSLIVFGTCTCCFTLLLSFKSYAMLVFMYEVSLTICS